MEEIFIILYVLMLEMMNILFFFLNNVVFEFNFYFINNFMCFLLKKIKYRCCYWDLY